MHARRRLDLVLVMGVLAGAVMGCDWSHVLGDPELPPPTSPQTPAVDASPPADGPPGYDAMCLHYCQALEETDLLVCASPGTGMDADACQATTPTVDSCVQLRCLTHRVDASLCLTQCDSLARFYDARCPVAGPSPDTLCPTSQAEHDQACRTGCGH